MLTYCVHKRKSNFCIISSYHNPCRQKSFESIKMTNLTTTTRRDTTHSLILLLSENKQGYVSTVSILPSFVQFIKYDLPDVSNLPRSQIKSLLNSTFSALSAIGTVETTFIDSSHPQRPFYKLHPMFGFISRVSFPMNALPREVLLILRQKGFAKCSDIEIEMGMKKGAKIVPGLLQSFLKLGLVAKNSENMWFAIP